VQQRIDQRTFFDDEVRSCRVLAAMAARQAGRASANDENVNIEDSLAGALSGPACSTRTLLTMATGRPGVSNTSSLARVSTFNRIRQCRATSRLPAP
jgi:hypothetical protein